MIDFDNIDYWEPSLSKALRSCVSDVVTARMSATSPEFIEDSLSLLFKSANRDAIIDATLQWLSSSTIVGYHGTRLNDADLASIYANGLLPLKAEARRFRLIRALSAHPRWNDVSESLDSAIQAHGPGQYAGRRENQVHLTLSRKSLIGKFNYYLTHGSEFDYHVAHALLGEEGIELLRHDGRARLVVVAIPGADALNAAHAIFDVEYVRKAGEVPNIVREFLHAWSYRLPHPGFQSGTMRVDRGMKFRTAIPPSWITNVETLSM